MFRIYRKQIIQNEQQQNLNPLSTNGNIIHKISHTFNTYTHAPNLHLKFTLKLTVIKWDESNVCCQK